MPCARPPRASRSRRSPARSNTHGDHNQESDHCLGFGRAGGVVRGAGRLPRLIQVLMSERKPTDGIELSKRTAARAAALLVEDGMRVGLGTGSTVAYLPPALAP